MSQLRYGLSLLLRFLQNFDRNPYAQRAETSAGAYDADERDSRDGRAPRYDEPSTRTDKRGDGRQGDPHVGGFFGTSAPGGVACGENPRCLAAGFAAEAHCPSKLPRNTC